MGRSTDKKQKNAAVESLTKNNSRNYTERQVDKDNTQHMKKIKRWVWTVATVNSATTMHRNHEWKKVTEKQQQLQESLAHESQGKQGGQGRSVQEVFLADEVKRNQKKMEKMQRKWPNLQRPQSLSQKAQASFSATKRGISDALRAQTMKGVAQSQSGSDARGLMAASVAGFTPGYAPEQDYMDDFER